MGFVLGWGWVLFRLVFGIAMVLGIAYLAERYTESNNVDANKEGLSQADATFNQQLMLEPEVSTEGVMLRWAREFMSLTIKLLPEYLVLVLLLGATRAWLFPVFGADDSIIWIFALALAGMLFVIPTAGEVPIVQAMFALGMGAGPAAALIMTLPAVSLPSLVMLGKVFSLRIRLLIAVGVVLSGIIAGFAAKYLF